MPEVKNTFVQSKMNKDLDGRLLPNGQYRDGENVQISKSEGDDVGALETVLGNDFLTDFGLNIDNLDAIGSLFDDTTNNVFLFLTNYTDSSPDQLQNTCTGIDGTACFIVQYNTVSQTSSILVEGNFLNFSKSSPITGVNLLENLLFWTDNRNQPRKININQATPGYYTTEDQISVSKYYPYSTPLLLDEGSFTGSIIDPLIGYKSTMKDTTSKYLPPHAAATIEAFQNGALLLSGEYFNIKPTTPNQSPQNFTNDGSKISGAKVGDNVVVDTVLVGGGGAFPILQGKTIVTFFGSIGSAEVGDIIYFQNLNPDYDPLWSGDPEYLKDKFARLSYRFKFEDDEYSLSAPFTQTVFIPQQDGYFIGNDALYQFEAGENPGDPNIELPSQIIGQESDAFDSTVVRFMENKVTDVDMCILAPTEGNQNTPMLWKDVRQKLKIVAIDILFKPAEVNNVYVIDTLELEEFATLNSSKLYYNYQSKKPWKTIPTDQVTRVNDVTPIRALAQESSGNRIIYGNYIDKHQSPNRLDYFIQVAQKPPLPDREDTFQRDTSYWVRKEYQNHTLKQNRTYQVGVVLSDRYGRQSNVILSDLLKESTGAKNSTVFHAYKSSEDLIIRDKVAGYVAPAPPQQGTGLQEPDTWPGDLLTVIFNNIIPKAKTISGYPGVYSEADGTLNSVSISDNVTYPPMGASNECTITLPIFGPAKLIVDPNLPDETPRAELTFVFINNNGVTTLQSVSVTNSNEFWTNGMEWQVDWNDPSILLSPACSWLTNLAPGIGGVATASASNPLGWYSYKIVVKQTEQEYYNVYLPNALAGYPCDQPENETDTCITVGPPYSNDCPQPSKNLKYPSEQYRTISHVVLFGDNVNKVPRDLDQVGPLQADFSSEAVLFPRVDSRIEETNGVSFYMSYQKDSDPLGDDVISVASMSRSGLGEVLIDPDYPIIPNIFYNGKKDPLIGKINTKKQFGMSTTDLGGCTDQTETEPRRNTVYGYGPTLTVMETKPVESLLDIFWETSTSGLISELNYNIEFNDNTAPVGISFPNITFSEGDGEFTPVSSTFSAIGPTGLSLGALVDIELIEATNAIDGDITEKFTLLQPQPGEFQLAIAPWGPQNNGFLHWFDPQRNQFTFQFKLTRLSTGTSSMVEAGGQVFNREPNERLLATDGITPITWNSIKDAICDQSSDLETSTDRRAAQTLSLKAEFGQQKVGIDRNPRRDIPGGNDGDNNGKAFYGQYIAPESSFENREVNYGKIAPTDDEFVFTQQVFPSPTTGTQLPGIWTQNITQKMIGTTDFGYYGFSSICGFNNEGACNDPNGSCNSHDDEEYFGKAIPTGVGSNGMGQKIYSPYNTARDLKSKSWVDSGVYPSPTDTEETYRRSAEFLYLTDLGIFDNNPWTENKPTFWQFPGLSPNGVDMLTFDKNVQGVAWDGIFRVANGSYGSIKPQEGWGSSILQGTALEIEWSIPRMYQVSMMVPPTEDWHSEGGSWALGNFWTQDTMRALKTVYYSPLVAWIAISAAFTAFLTFGWVVVGGIAIAVGAIATATVITALIKNLSGIKGRYYDAQPPGEVVFGLQDIDAVQTNNSGAQKRNELLDYMPKGPIYFHANSDNSGRNFRSGGGENIVGEKNNVYTSTNNNQTLSYPHHYWPDLNARLQGSTDYQDFREDPTVANAPDFMKLQDGGNTFYQWRRASVVDDGNWQEKRSYNVACFPAYMKAWKMISQWKMSSDGKNANNLVAAGVANYAFHMTGLNSSRKGNPNTDIKFFLKPLNPTGVVGQDITSNAELYAGNPDKPSQEWNPNNESGTPRAAFTGNGMPGGRYVVTVRATDVSVGGDKKGEFVEWDVPIYLPWWATRANTPVRPQNDSVSNGEDWNTTSNKFYSDNTSSSV